MMGIRTVFKSTGTLRQLLMNVKTPTLEMNGKEVVYQIPCQDCDSVYIGETGRSLGKRIMEHKYAVQRSETGRMEWQCMHGMKDTGWTGKEQRSLSRNNTS